MDCPIRLVRLLLWSYFFLVLVLPGATVLWATLAHFSPSILTDRIYLSSLLHSLSIASATTFLATLIGTFSAVLVAKYKLPGQKLWTLLLSLPILFVPYQFALAWSALLPSGKLSLLLFSPVGVIFVLTGSFYPLAFWLALMGFFSIPPEEEESGLLVAPPRRVFFKITLPRARPYILSAALIIFLLAFSEVGVPTYLGVTVLPCEILTRFAAFYDVPVALTAAFPLTLLGLGLFLLEAAALRRGLCFQQRMSERGLRFTPGIFKGPFLLFLGTVILLFTLVPFWALLQEAAELKDIILALKHAGGALLRSLFYSLATACLAGLWALGTVYFLKSQRGLFSLVTLLDFFLPPVVLAVGLIYFWQDLPWVYGSTLLLLLGLLARFSFLPQQVLSSAYEHLDPAGEEAALLCGTRPLKVLLKIIYPQLRRWFYLGTMLVFVFSMNELGLSTMLYPPGGEPLVVSLYTLSVNNPVGVSATLALMNSLGTLGLAAFLYWKGTPNE